MPTKITHLSKYSYITFYLMLFLKTHRIKLQAVKRKKKTGKHWSLISVAARKIFGFHRNCFSTPTPFLNY